MIARRNEKATKADLEGAVVVLAMMTQIQHKRALSLVRPMVPMVLTEVRLGWEVYLVCNQALCNLSWTSMEIGSRSRLGLGMLIPTFALL